jgi:hypothetical protein
MPKVGKRAKGIREVAGIGIGSKIHQIAVHRVMLAVSAIGSPRELSSQKYTRIAASGPSNVNSNFCLAMVNAVFRCQDYKIQY